jgi:chromosome partitioning protein
MEIIAMVNEKGGTGKTTSTVNLAAALGEMGKKVLLVDLDGQAATSRWLGVEGDTRFADALLRGKGLEPIHDILPNVDLAPGHGKLDSVAHDLRPTQGGQLRKLLHRVEGYDYVLIDCPPSLGNRLIGNALLAATHALVPVETSVLALDGLKILLTTLEDVRDGFGHDIILLGVLACRYDGRTRLSRLVLAELKRALPNHLFQTVIRENVKVRECPASGQSILEYAGDSNGAEDYRALAREVVGQLDAAGGAEVAELVDAVEHFEQVADELEDKAETEPAGEETIPDIDGCWDKIGDALGSGESPEQPANKAKQRAEPKPEPKPQSKPAPAAAAAPAPQAQPEPEPQPTAQPVQQAQPEPAEQNEPATQQTQPVQVQVIPAAEPADKPSAQQSHPPAPAPAGPTPQARQADPPQRQSRPQSPPKSAPKPKVQNVQPAEPSAGDLQTWPAEVDVVRAEMAEKQQQDEWDESDELQAAAVGDDKKKAPTWLRFFTGSRG